MSHSAKIVMKQAHIVQLHDEIDWLVEKMGEVYACSLYQGHPKCMELIKDVRADIERLKSILPPRQQKLDL